MDISWAVRMPLLLMALLLWIANAVEGEIRCYCNDASCVRTGYMCKSTSGGCYSQLTYEGDSSRSRHGCVESLPEDDKNACAGDGDVIKAKNGPDEEWPILMCCREDMCNYMDSLDINIYVNTKSNGTKDPNSSRGGESVARGVGQSPPEGQANDYKYLDDISQKDLWFKAAVIAVPIAGGFILILLVLLAVRVLRNDSRRHRQLMQMRHHHSLTKAQLYVTDHFCHHPDSDSGGGGGGGDGVCSKGEKCPLAAGQADRHSIVTIKDTRPPKQQQTHSKNVHSSTAKPSNVYRDVHIKIDHSKQGYEKIRPVSDSSSHEGACNSVVLWGEERRVDRAAVV